MRATQKLFAYSFLLFFWGFVHSTYAQNYGSGVTDIDGNVYTSVIIGSQEWMAENLKVTKFNDGTPIVEVSDNISWSNITSPAWCWLNNDSSSFDSIYGKLYNYYVVADTNSRNICPVGWKVPTYNYYNLFFNYLNGQNSNYDSLKSQTGWDGHNGTDTYGLKLLPSGARFSNGNFEPYSNYIWSSSYYYDEYAIPSMGGYFWPNGLDLTNDNNTKGSAIRCIKVDTTYADSCQANFNISKGYPNASASTYPNITYASSIAGSDNLDKVEVKISKDSISIFDSIVSYGYGRSYDVNSPDFYDDIFYDDANNETNYILPVGKYHLTIQINLETSLGCKDTVIYTYDNSWNDTTCSASHTSWLLQSSGANLQSAYTKAYNNFQNNGGPYIGIIDSIGFYTLAVHNPIHQNTGTSSNVLEETHILSKNNTIINNLEIIITSKYDLFILVFFINKIYTNF